MRHLNHGKMELKRKNYNQKRNQKEKKKIIISSVKCLWIRRTRYINRLNLQVENMKRAKVRLR